MVLRRRLYSGKTQNVRLPAERQGKDSLCIGYIAIYAVRKRQNHLELEAGHIRKNTRRMSWRDLDRVEGGA